MNKKVHSAGIVEHSDLSVRPIGLRVFSFDFLAVTFGGKSFFLQEERGTASIVNPVSVVYVPAGQKHIYDPENPEHWKNCWILFDADCARQSFNEILPAPGITTIQNVDKLKNYWQRLSQCMLGDSNLEDEQAFCLFHQILIEIKLQRSQIENNRSSSVTADIINLMYKQLHNPELQFEAVALKNGIALDSLKKRFKRETGMPLHQYFIKLKINVAKSMLANLNYRIADLAYFLGFENQYYFSRLFKKKTGMSPVHFRKQTMMSKQKKS